MSIFNSIPKDIQVIIFSLLDVYDLSFSTPTVCKEWNKLSNDQRIWKQLYPKNELDLQKLILQLSPIPLFPQDEGDEILHKRYVFSLISYEEFEFDQNKTSGVHTGLKGAIFYFISKFFNKIEFNNVQAIEGGSR